MTPAEAEHFAVEVLGLPSREETAAWLRELNAKALVIGQPIYHRPSRQVFRFCAFTLPTKPSPTNAQALLTRDAQGRICTHALGAIHEFESLYAIDDIELLSLARLGLARPNRGRPSSISTSVVEINRLLARMPSDWRNQLDSNRKKLRAAGARPDELPPKRPDAHSVLKALNLNNQGSLSSEVDARPSEHVPEDVRQAAMDGIRLSHEHNYGGYDFIGVARAIQLAVSPAISAQAKNRMRMYFDRKFSQDRLSDQYRSHYGKRYWSWLNWGGDPGARWSGSTRFRKGLRYD